MFASKLILIVLQSIFVGFAIFGQESINGIYYARGKIKSSELRMNSSGRFEYFYRLGGCQSTVYGGWKIEGKKLILNADDEFLKNSVSNLSPIYPIFRSFNWKIKGTGLVPEQEIDTGCFRIKKLHKRMETTDNRVR